MEEVLYDTIGSGCGIGNNGNGGIHFPTYTFSTPTSPSYSSPSSESDGLDELFGGDTILVDGGNHLNLDMDNLSPPPSSSSSNNIKGYFNLFDGSGGVFVPERYCFHFYFIYLF